MGGCVSRCGETHHQGAGVGPAAISHRNHSFENNTESLKKFLLLHAAVDAKKSALSSPRTSLGDSPVIPHSSELFSLPASEPDRSSFAISPSPGLASRASVSTRVANSSPKSRTCSVWGGRFAVDKTSTGCRKRVRPAPRGRTCEHDAAAHQRLVEAIARLERLNDGKQCGSQGSGPFSNLERKASTMPPQLTVSRSRHVRHYQLPLQLPKSNPDAIAMATPVSPLANSVTNLLREVENFVSLIEAPQETKRVRPKPTVPNAISRLAVSYGCDETDSDEMFTFFEASSSSDDVSEVRMKPSPIATSLQRLVQSATQGCHRIEKLSPLAPKSVVLPVAKPAKSSSECTKSPPSKLNSVNQSAEQSRAAIANIESADLGIESTRGKRGDSEAAGAAVTDIDMNVVAMLKKLPSVKRSSPSRIRALKGFQRRPSRSLDSRESAVIHVDFDSLFRNAPIAASRLSNVVVSDNIYTTASQATLIDAKSTEDLELLLPISGMCSCADIILEQDVCEKEDEENSTVDFLDTATVELATPEQPSQVMLATSNDSLSSWIREVQDQSLTISEETCLSELQSLDENPSPAELAANLEILSQQVLLVEDKSLSTTVESCLREPERLDGNPLTVELTTSEQSSQVMLDEELSPSTLASAESSFRELDNLDSILEFPETKARCEETLSPESTVCTEPASPSLSSSCPTETGVQADYHSIPDSTHSEVVDSHRFLSNAFNSLLKLLLITDRGQTGIEYTAALHQDEKQGSVAETNNWRARIVTCSEFAFSRNRR